MGMEVDFHVLKTFLHESRIDPVTTGVYSSLTTLSIHVKDHYALKGKLIQTQCNTWTILFHSCVLSFTSLVFEIRLVRNRCL